MTQPFDADSHPIRRDCIEAAALLIATGAVLNETVEIPSWLSDVIVMGTNS